MCKQYNLLVDAAVTFRIVVLAKSNSYNSGSKMDFATKGCALQLMRLTAMLVGITVTFVFLYFAKFY